MTGRYANLLTPDRALIWRIVHRDNLPWLWANGLHCGNSPATHAGWVPIGNSELIAKRAEHPVPAGPGGSLNDYVPFYFTPFSPMLRNIRSGRGGVRQRQPEELVILVSSLHRMRQHGLDVVFTDSHAYYQWANFYTDFDDLRRIDWALLQRCDFRRDPDDPAKFERYQAEALVHRHLPMSSLMGLVVSGAETQHAVAAGVRSAGLELPVENRPRWFFP